MFIDSGNNLNPHGSKAYLNDLNSAADKESMTIPLILPDVTYDIGDQDGVKLYFNTEPPIDEVGGFVINFGGSYPIENVGIININAFFTPFEEVWENPYITGVDRQTTRTSRYGARVAFNRILGTGLRVNVVYMNDDVDEDVIGKLMPELSRDGAVYALNANYSFNITPNDQNGLGHGRCNNAHCGCSFSYTTRASGTEKWSHGMLIPARFESLRR